MKEINNNLKLELDFEGEDSIAADSVGEIYPLKEIRIDKGRMSIYEFKRKYDNQERGNIILNPDFQRDENRWKNKQKAELIESIVMGIPLPVIYLFQDEKGIKQVVDGRQRLTCIAEFLDNKFELKDLEILTNLNKKYFKDLEPYLQNKIEDYQLEIYTILPPAPDRVKFNIFDRLNRGGTKLNNQEMRNALYQGTSTKVIKQMSEFESFKKATGYSLNAKTMKDRYLILRFVSFYLLRTNRLGGMDLIADIDEFLKNVMQYMNTKDELEYEKLVQDFDKTMQFIDQNYSDSVFRFRNKEDKNRRRPINMALFECVTYMFMLALQKNINIDIDKFEEFKSSEFDKPERFTYGIDSKDNVKFRFDSVENFLGIYNDTKS